MLLKRKYLVVLAFLIVILIGIFLRFNYLEYTPFQSHVVSDLEISKDIAEGKEFRLAGITSDRTVSGEQQTFGPASYYLFALPLLFNKSPLVVVGLIALLSVLSFILCFKFGKEFFNERTGLIAATLFAVSPWAIFFSNIMTNAFLMPFFVMLFIYSLFKLIIKNKDHYVISCLISLAILLQLHLSSLLLIPVVLLSLLLFKRKINLKYLAIGLFITFLFFTPFIYHNITNPDAGSILGHMTDRPSGTILSNAAESIGMPFVIAGTYFGKYVFGDNYIFNSFFASNLFLVITIAIVIYLLLGLMFIFYNGTRKLKKEYVLLLIWFVLPVLLYLFLFRSNISPHFYLILLPAQFLILGILFNHTYNKRKILTLITISIILVASVVYSIGFFNYLDENGGSTAIYKLTYKTKAEVVDFILKDSNNFSPNIYYINNIDKGYNYIFEQHRAYPKYVKLDSYDDLYEVNGYYISERYWRQHWFNEDPENKVLDDLDSKNIHNIEIFALSNKK